MTDAERRRAFGVAGLALVALGGVMYLEQPKGTPKPKPGPGPAPGPLPAYPRVRMGSAWVQRAGWVRDHGTNGPLYGADGLLAGWIPFGTVLQTTGPITNRPVGYIGADGSSCCAAGSNAMYPVQGGFVAPIDVVVV